MPSTFTAHNILLSDGEQTAPNLGWFIADSPWLRAALRVINTIYPAGAAGHSIVDLGCLEGGYTLEFAKAGMIAKGIEIRQSNIDNCEFVRQHFSLPELSFEKANVWDFQKFGRFDVAFCCGLLYHLDNPRSFLRLMAQSVNDAVIINTHVALEENSQRGLSELTEHEGMQGRWYVEYDPAAMDHEKLEAAKWTSWGNSRSFWPTKASLCQAILDDGFDMVFEQMDWLAPNIDKKMQAEFYKNGRRMLVGVRSSTAA